MMGSQTSKINREACAWIAKFHDVEPSSQELAEFREWMQQSAEHKAEMRRMARRWDELNVLTELAVPVEATGTWKTWRGGWGALFLSLFNRRITLGAVTAVAVLAVVTVLWSPLDINHGAALPAYATAIGEQRLVTLPDSSTVLLNTNSRINVSYTGEFRTIHLVQGEAHFDVWSNPGRPFRVFAGKSMVRAVGTAFSVYLNNEMVEVTVTDGSVEIDAVQNTVKNSMPSTGKALKPAVVSAGQSAVFDQIIESVEMIELMEISDKLSWHEGLLKFSGDPLEEVVEEISRYTTLSIVILDPKLKDLRIGGFFKVGETNKMFEALEVSFGIQVERIDENLVHLSATTHNP